MLQALMVQINHKYRSFRSDSGELHPHDVFRLVAGTSTGALIALMLGKMGMTVEECIKQYYKLSKDIFGKKHFRGRITHGLAPARYSGKRLRNCIQRLLRDRQLDENLQMAHAADRVAWYVAPTTPRPFTRNAPAYIGTIKARLISLIVAVSAVVCREHEKSSQYSKLKERPVPICSLPCKDNLLCSVCDAARATSAAPTFFPVMRIKDRFFVDGGLGNNNPSFAIYFHYHRIESKKLARLRADTSTYSPHGDLDCSSLRFTNIGTGAKADEVEPGKRDRLAGLIPGAIRKGVFLKQTLKEIAVNSDNDAHRLRHFQHLNDNDIMYERFDANHGVSNIRLDDHKALLTIRERTEQYLDEQITKDLLKEVGSAIANDYHSQSVQSNGLPIETSRQQVKVSNTTSASSSQTSHLSSHSNYPESEPHDLSPSHNDIQKGGPAPLTEHSAANSLPLNARGQFKYLAYEDPEIRTIESENEMLTAPS